MGIEAITWLMLASLVTLLLIGVPMGFATGIIAVVATSLTLGPQALSIISSRVFAFVTEYVLISVPMFVLMAEVLDRSGVARDLFRVMRVAAGGLPGGLAVQTMIAATIMAAMTGIIGGEITLLGLVALPQMLAAGYDRKLAIGTICAGGSLGTMIPPSLVLVIYGITADVSIGDLFLASFVPGLLLSSCYIAYVLGRCLADPRLGPPLPPEARQLAPEERALLLRSIALPILVIASVMISIYAGIASVSEAAGMGVVGAIVAAALRRELSAAMLLDAAKGTLNTCGKIIWLSLGATALVGVYNVLGGGSYVRDAIGGLDLPPIVIVIIMQLIVIVLGCFMDWIGICLLVMPIFVPIVKHLGFDPVWFGVLFSLNVQVSFLSPPFAGAAFYLKSVAPKEITLEMIYNSLWPFIAIQLVVLTLVIFVPDIALILPRLLD